MSLAPPAKQGGWSYSGEFHAEASNSNWHRRATIPELKALFDSADGPKDRPGHWYEAQLLHYGLPPSKTKGTAKMRLFDAVNNGNLVVPNHILKVEAELKKEWTKREREAKQALKKLAAPAATTPARGANKRKADDGQAAATPKTNANVTPAGPASEKAKTTPTPNKSTPAKTASVPSSRSAPQKKQTARRGAFSAVSFHPAPPAPRRDPTRQTARRSRPFNPASQGRPTPAGPPPSRYDTTPARWEAADDPPPPYPGSPVHRGDRYRDNGDDDDDGDGPYGSHMPPPGLLNGRYRLRCTAPHHLADRGEDSAVVFTLDGDALWGSFEIGPLSGILYLDERPWAASRRPLFFAWRGNDTQGGVHDENSDGSYIMFMGDGVVVGKIGFYGSMLDFDGYRVSGQETRSEISAAQMGAEWADRRL